MPMATSIRWGAFRNIGAAVRATTRPSGPSMGKRLACLPRLVAATLRGEYDGTSPRSLLVLLGAVLYVVSPVDLMPEAIFAVFGLGDDAVVVSWIAVAVINETERFLEWERARAETITGDVLS